METTGSDLSCLLCFIWKIWRLIRETTMRSFRWKSGRNRWKKLKRFQRQKELTIIWFTFRIVRKPQMDKSCWILSTTLSMSVTRQLIQWCTLMKIHVRIFVKHFLKMIPSRYNIFLMFVKNHNDQNSRQEEFQALWTNFGPKKSDLGYK